MTKKKHWQKEYARRAQRKYKLKVRYGIKIEEYEKLFNKQKQRCGVCGKHQSMQKRSFAVDHCHKTKRVRGILCSKCNLALGHFNDSIKVIAKAMKYLKGD